MTELQQNDELYRKKIAELRSRIIQSLLQMDPSYGVCLAELLNLNCPLIWKLRYINISKILQDNCMNLDGLKALCSGMGILKRYAVNLVKPIEERPNLWNVISYLNAVFRDKVITLQGTKDILLQLGYREQQDGLYYDENRPENRHFSAEMTADLFYAHTEMQVYLTSQHPYPLNLEAYLPLAARLSFLEGKGIQGSKAVASTMQPFANTKMPNTSQHQLSQHVRPVLSTPARPSVNTGPGTSVGMSRIPPSLITTVRPGGPVSSYSPAAPTLPSRTKPPVAWEVVPPSVPFMPPSLILQQLSFSASRQDDKHRKTTPAAPEPQDTAAVEIPKECEICGSEPVVFKCQQCRNPQFLCRSCDTTYHQHRDRRSHKRDDISKPRNEQAIPKFSQLLNAEDTTSGISTNREESTDLQVIHREAKSEVKIPDVKPITTPFQSQLIQELEKIYDLEVRVKKCKELITKLENEVLNKNRDIEIYRMVEPSPKQQKELTRCQFELDGLHKEKKSLETYCLQLETVLQKDTNANEEHIYQQLVHPTGLPRSSSGYAYLNEHGRSSESSTATGSSQSAISPLVNLQVSGFPGLTRSESQERALTDVRDRLSQVTGPPSDVFEPEIDIITEAVDIGRHVSPLESAGSTVNTSVDNPSKKHWSCEHCTFFNEHNTKICVQCFRTSDNPKMVSPEDEVDKTCDLEKLDLATDVQPHSSSSRCDHHVEEKYLPGGTESHVSTVMYRSQAVDYHDQVLREKLEAKARFEENIAKEEELKADNKNSQKIQKEFSEIGLPQVAEVKSQGTGAGDFEASKSYKQTSQNEKLLKENVSKYNERHPALSATLPSNLGDVDSIIYSSLEKNDSLDDKNFHLEMEKLLEKKKVEETTLCGRELVRELRQAEDEGFSVEDFETALLMSDEGTKPMTLLRDQWAHMLQLICDNAQLSGKQQDIHFTSVSVKDAKKCLHECQGHLENATQLCVKNKMEQVKKLCDRQRVSVQEAYQAIDESEDDYLLAENNLISEIMQPFFERVWADDTNMSSLFYENMHSSVTEPQFEMSIRDSAIDIERRIRMVLVEGSLNGWKRAENVLELLEQDDLGSEVNLSDVIEAVKNYGDLHRSRSYLQQECETCYNMYPASKILCLSLCQCKVCADCMQQYFRAQIRDRHIKSLVCPVCQQPDINNKEVVESYFQFLGLMLKNLLSTELYELYEQKLRDWNLMQDSRFRWCSHETCGNGFLFFAQNLNHLKMECPNCKRFTCFGCKKRWEDQHDGLTCEEFQTWKEQNDPETQAAGLARHLEQNGIDCPNCKFRYTLAKGGCMHFKCTQCGHEFCSGCYKPFLRGDACKISQACRTLGLHCHHPRDCLYHLRDRDVPEMQKMIEDHQLVFDTDPPQNQKNTPQPMCPVMEQKETQDGLHDEMCNRPVPTNYAGLCEIHYKEYLVSLINKNMIDPAEIMSVDELKVQLTKGNVTVPNQKPNESDTEFRKRLVSHLQRHKPLKKMKAPLIIAV